MQEQQVVFNLLLILSRRKNEKISIWLLSIVVLLCVTSCKENNEPEMKKNNYTEKAKDIQLEENEFTSIVLTTSEKIVYNKIDEMVT